MADKVKTAFLLAGGCAGCEMSVVDLSEALVGALEHLEIVFWAPTVADVKYKDLEDMPDKSIDLAFVDGMMRNSENLHTVKVLRQKSKILVAFGACATLGGIAALFQQAPTDAAAAGEPRLHAADKQFGIARVLFVDAVVDVIAVIQGSA